MKDEPEAISESREAVMELVHRFAGDDHLDDFSAALDAYKRSMEYHWKTEFQECYDELTETRKARDAYRGALRHVADENTGVEPALFAYAVLNPE